MLNPSLLPNVLRKDPFTHLNVSFPSPARANRAFISITVGFGTLSAQAPPGPNGKEHREKVYGTSESPLGDSAQQEEQHRGQSSHSGQPSPSTSFVWSHDCSSFFSISAFLLALKHPSVSTDGMENEGCFASDIISTK